MYLIHLYFHLVLDFVIANLLQFYNVLVAEDLSNFDPAT